MNGCAKCVQSSSYAGGLREKCDALNALHGAERVARCWGAGAGLRFDQTRDAITNLLQVVPLMKSLALLLCSLLHFALNGALLFGGLVMISNTYCSGVVFAGVQVKSGCQRS